MFYRVGCIALSLGLSLIAWGQLPNSAQERHEYDLLNVKWDLSFDFSKGQITGDVTNTVSPLKDSAELLFDCPKLKIISVEVNGAAAAMEDNGKVLSVKPKSRVVKGKKLDIRIRYSGAPEAGIYFVPAARAFPAHTDIVYTQGEMVDNRFWLPTYDEPGDKATSEGFIHVPSGWKALSNGKLIEVRHEGATDLWHWKMDKAHSTYLISMVAGPYDEVVDGSDPVPVSFWVPEGLDDWGRAAFGSTDKVVQFYGKLTGFTYPWPKYSQSAVADFMFGGMENVSCTTQTIGALHPMSVDSTENSTGLVAHELAHQWFGDTITTRDWSHIWLNEGWASFLPNFWDREKYGEEAYDLDRLGVFQGGLGAHAAAPEKSEVWTKYEEPIDMFDGFAYPGGASRMFMLMHQVGEEKFWPAITKFLNEYKFKNVTTEEFFGSVSKSLGIDLEEFRKQWFYTPAAPSLKVVRDGRSVFIEQGKTPFHLPLDIWLIDSNGKIEKRKVDLPATARYEITGAEKRLVLVDPEVWLMANVSYDLGYQSADWRKLYDLAPNAAEKAFLLPMALTSFSLEEKVSLGRSEKSERMLERIVSEVPDLDFQLDMSRNPDDRIVASAARTLGNLPRSPKSEQRLGVLWGASPNSDIRRAALGSLLKLTNDEALANEALKVDSFNDGFRLDTLNWWQGHNVDRARELAFGFLASSSASEPLKLAAMRVLGHVKDRAGEHRAYDLLTGFLTDRSNSPLRTAIGALAEYGDKAAIPLIEARANHSLHFVRRDVQAALATLRGK